MKRLISFIIVFVIFSPFGALGQTQFKALVLACPSEYHYEFIEVAKQSFREMADMHHFDMNYSSEAWVLEGDLSVYDVIVFLNTDAERLNEAQRAGLQRYVASGKGFVAVHRSIGLAKDWAWYRDLVGRSLTIHPIMQTGVVEVVDGSHPSTLAMPEQFLWTEEWYETEAFDESPLHVLLEVDESSYDPTWIWAGQEAHGMGEHHPVAWTQTFEGCRVFVTTMGHLAAAYRNQRYLDHLYGGIFWAAKGEVGK